MYDINELKPLVEITDETVECPCLLCTTIVARARRGQSLRQRSFLCSQHKIFISPSDFHYQDEWENLLWCDVVERQLFKAIRPFKRECRFERNNSEDALTWNAFRYLEKTNRLAEFLAAIVESPVEKPAVSYWSYSISTGAPYERLTR